MSKRLPQAKFFINGVIKEKSQAIRMVLHIIILKVVPKDKKEGVESTPEGVGAFQLQGVLISATKGGCPPLVHL